MKGVKSILLLLIYFSFAFTVVSQSTLFAPIPIPSNYMYAVEFFNPSLIEKENKYNFNLSRSAFTGIRKVFRTDFVSFSLNNENKHTYIIQFLSEKKGKWINSTGGLIGYVFHVDLSDDLILSSGVNVGFHQVGVAPNSSGLSGSVIKPNARVSVAIEGENVKVGLAVNDFVRRNFVFAEEANVFPVLINFNLEYRTQVNDALWLKLGNLTRFVEYKSTIFQSFILAEYHEVLEFGVSITNANLLMGLVQINKLKLVGGGEGSIFFGYETAFKSGGESTASSKYSIGINYLVF